MVAYTKSVWWFDLDRVYTVLCYLYTRIMYGVFQRIFQEILLSTDPSMLRRAHALKKSADSERSAPCASFDLSGTDLPVQSSLNGSSKENLPPATFGKVAISRMMSDFLMSV